VHGVGYCYYTHINLFRLEEILGLLWTVHKYRIELEPEITAHSHMSLSGTSQAAEIDTTLSTKPQRESC
jgi:hypothetical protein